jgi:hypothetical protein
MVQSGLSQSGKERITNALGGGQKGSGGAADVLGGLGKMLGGGGGGIEDILGSVLGGATGKSGGSKLAVAGLGALAGAIFGGGKRSARGAVGGGTLAMLASLAFSALSKYKGTSSDQVPPGLLEPETQEQQQELERDAELIV